LSQLEHDANARAFLVTNSKMLIKKVKNEIKKLMAGLPTKTIVQQSIKNLKIIFVRKIDDAIPIANNLAPEHLELQIKRPEKYLNKLANYGSLFLGKYESNESGGSPESLPEKCLE
jgi:histidinol dehydrogenase